MKRFLIIGNIILIFLFWIAALTAVTPAYNHFVQYGPQGAGLPSLTSVVLSCRSVSIAVPVCWSLFLYLTHRNSRKNQQERSNTVLLGLTVSTLCIGMILLIIFLSAGILPFLKIGALIR